jgi:hypothetical protein
MSKRRRKTFMLPDEVQEAKMELDCESDEELGLLVGVSRDTIFRYRNGQSPVPYAVARLLEIYRQHPELQRYSNPWEDGHDFSELPEGGVSEKEVSTPRTTS